MTPRLKHMVRYNNLDRNLATWIYSHIKSPIFGQTIIGKSMSNDLWKAFGYHNKRYVDTLDIRLLAYPGIPDPVLDIVDSIPNGEKVKIQSMIDSGQNELIELAKTLRNVHWDNYWLPRVKKAVYNGENIESLGVGDFPSSLSDGEDSDS